MTLKIQYESEAFPPGAIPAEDELSTSWDDLLWAAVTVGRPSWRLCFRFGDASIYEALFRWSVLRMALEQVTPAGFRLLRTDAAKALDPTEKGAVNYFLGMTFCKLFAAKRLGTPWILHVDVFREELAITMLGRKRPDLVGMNALGQWHAFESKGRGAPPDAKLKARAKGQGAASGLRVNGTSCSLHVGAITYFRQDFLHFYWADPVVDRGLEVDVRLDERQMWAYYFAPIVETIREHRGFDSSFSLDQALVALPELDLEVGAHPLVVKHLAAEDWLGAQRAAREAAREIHADGYQVDGLVVKAGASWREPRTSQETSR